MTTQVRREAAVEGVMQLIRSALEVTRVASGDDIVDEALQRLGLSRGRKAESTVQSPGTHLASAMGLVEDFVLPAETGPNGNNDSVEAAVCLRRRIRDAQTCWSTLEALRQKQGR